MRDEIEARRQVALARRAAALQQAPSPSQLEPREPGAVTDQGASAAGDGCVAVGASARVSAEATPKSIASSSSVGTSARVSDGGGAADVSAEATPKSIASSSPTLNVLEESPHGRRGLGPTAVSVTPSTAPRRVRAVALMSCGSRLRGSLINARGAPGGGAGRVQSGVVHKSTSSASAEGSAVDSPSGTPPACASHVAEDAPVRAFDTSARIAVASSASDGVPDSRAAPSAGASELSDHALLRRDLEFAACERRRKTESSYYGNVVHPLEELSAAKKDKNGNPIRENFVKMQHFKRRKFKGRGSKAGGRYGIGGHKLSNGRGFKGKVGRGGKGKGTCFLCGKAGHWAQDCPKSGGSGEGGRDGTDSLEAIADELEAPGLAAEAGSRHSRRGMAAPSDDAVELAEASSEEEAPGLAAEAGGRRSLSDVGDAPRSEEESCAAAGVDELEEARGGGPTSDSMHSRRAAVSALAGDELDEARDVESPAFVSVERAAAAHPWERGAKTRKTTSGAGTRASVPAGVGARCSSGRVSKAKAAVCRVKGASVVCRTGGRRVSRRGHGTPSVPAVPRLACLL